MDPTKPWASLSEGIEYILVLPSGDTPKDVKNARAAWTTWPLCKFQRISWRALRPRQWSLTACLNHWNLHSRPAELMETWLHWDFRTEDPPICDFNVTYRNTKRQDKNIVGTLEIREFICLEHRLLSHCACPESEAWRKIFFRSLKF